MKTDISGDRNTQKSEHLLINKVAGCVELAKAQKFTQKWTLIKKVADCAELTKGQKSNTYLSIRWQAMLNWTKEHKSKNLLINQMAGCVELAKGQLIMVLVI